VAAANGVSGTVESIGDEAQAEAAEEPAVDPALAAAQAAIDAGDLDGAATAFKQLLDQRPGDPQATSGLARVELLQRVRGVDAKQARQAAADEPDDVAAQALAADLDIAGGHIEDAFARLVETVRRTSGDSRDSARLHLLALFEVVGPTDPRVTKARSALASALF